MFWMSDKSGQSPKEGEKKEMGQPSLDQLRAQALENARAAREHLGEDTINRIAEIMKRKETSASERAKAQIRSHSIEDLTRELRALVEEDGRFS